VHEVFPIVAGIVIGLGVLRIHSATMRTAALVVLSVIFGVIATQISGEALISWAFVLIDIPLVFFSAVGAIAVAYVWQRRREPQLNQ
jgi:hypothetical protein